MVTVAQVNNVSPEGLYYLIGNGDGSFQPHVSLNLPTYESLVVADFNLDGRRTWPPRRCHWASFRPSI